MLAFVTLCGLAFLVALLAVTGGAHLLAPAAFGHTLRRHGSVPAALATPAALLVAVGELALAAAAVAALATGGRRLTGLAFAAALVLGLGFLAYLRRLARSGHTGSCGCTPLDAPLTPASFVPAAALAVTGALGSCAVGLAATAAGGGALAPVDDAWSALAVAWGLVLAVPVLLLPASVPAPAAAGEAAVGEGAR